MNGGHDRFEELAVGHALAALEPDDEQAFLAHLRGCAACERNVAAHTETLSHLAYAAGPVELPDSLLSGIRAGVRASGRLMASPAAASERPATLDEARARRRLHVHPRSLTAAAAAAAVILSLGVWNATLRHGQSMVEARSQRLSSAVRLLETNASQQVPLADGSGRPIAVAVMQDDRTVSLVVDGLPRNDRATSTYVLWQTGDSGTRPVGTFDVTGSGVSLVRKLRLSPGLVGWNAFAITRESGRRAPAAPGSLPVANGSLRA